MKDFASTDSIADKLAQKQRDISIAEFFERNKHILGFDNLTKAMLTSVKEAVDNGLDACEEASILPELVVQIKTGKRKDEYVLTVEDNGPGIVRKQVPLVFGKLLYGSRFHAIRQSRGQQGIGISGVVMYGQVTTGKPALIRSKIDREEVAHEFELALNTKKNKPDILREEPVIWEKDHGTRIEVTLKGRMVRGKQSVHEYLRATAIVNPHASILFRDADGKEVHFERVSHTLPPECIEIRPHPAGVEVGTLIQMAKSGKSRRMTGFLHKEFSSVSPSKAKEICDNAGVDPNLKTTKMDRDTALHLIDGVQKTKFRAPDLNCLSPIGTMLIKKGLKNVLGGRAEFYSQPVTRRPTVYGGNPFQVEAGMVYGGNLPKDGQVEILRFANRVPLLYQQGADAITKAISEMDWRQYGLEQRGGTGIPYGPAIIMVHVASTRVPFTSEAKEAIAPVEELVAEIKLALRDSGRRLRTHLSKKKKRGKLREKFELVQEILPLIAGKSASMLDKPVPDLTPVITKIMNVVWVNTNLDTENGSTILTINTINYTRKIQKFKVYAALPMETNALKSVSPQGKVRLDGNIVWNVKLRSSERANFTIEMGGEVSDADDIEIFVDGVATSNLIGADPLPGDWGIDMSPYDRRGGDGGDGEPDGDAADEPDADEEGMEQGEEDEPDEESADEQEADEVEEDDAEDDDAAYDDDMDEGMDDDDDYKAGMTEDD